MSIRLIALDIDGTTLNSKGRLTERTKDALERAIESGVYVVMATGRCFDALPDDIMAISNMNYVVTSNGAMVRDLNTGEVILRNCLDPEVVVEAEKILRKYDCKAAARQFLPQDIPTLYSINTDAVNSRQIKRSKQQAST